MRESETNPDRIKVPLRPMRARRYLEIAVDSIVVVNSRKRDRKRFDENIRSIDAVGLYKPIIVNNRIFKSTKQYELICGEGRLLAYRRLGKRRIRAEIVNVSESVAHLMTLGENIARNAAGPIEAARALQQMRDDGMTHAQLSAITGRSEAHISRLLRLIDHGEARLIKGVEEGTLPLDFAASVAGAPTEEVQNLLIEALECGLIGSTHVSSVLKLITERMIERKDEPIEESPDVRKDLTIGMLRKEIQHAIKEKDQFSKQTQRGLTRVTGALIVMKKLLENPEFVVIARRENLPDIPPLSRAYII